MTTNDTTDQTDQTMNREEWLTTAANIICDKLFGLPTPNIRISCGFPVTGARASSKQRIGECWHSSASEDKTTEIFISPVLSDPVQVLSTVAHELIHAYHPGAGHKGAFVTMAKSIGFTAPMTQTPMTEGLRERLTTEILSELPDYPHAALRTGGRKKQSTRMLKAECPEDGYTVRLTRKWADFGMPVCPCGAEMVLDE